jgi:hypothetical protein
MIDDPIPERSTLLTLPIIDADGGESLASYVLRLARAHRAPYQSLVEYLRRRRPGRSLGAASWLRTVSGVGRAAREGAVSVGAATAMGDLHRLTLLPLDLLVRDSWEESSKWCPQCIEGFLQAPSYIPLKWSLRGLDVCNRHGTRLVRSCRCGDVNSILSPTYRCLRCEQSLAYGPQIVDEPSETESATSLAIETFFRWIAELPAPPHLGRFTALEELIELRKGTVERSSIKPASPRRGAGIFTRPRLTDVAQIAVSRDVPISQLFVVDPRSESMKWPQAAAGNDSRIDWAPIFQAANDAAALGRPIAIQMLQQRFNVDQATLRRTLTRRKIPWARVRVMLSCEMREKLEHSREMEVEHEARRWLESGGLRRFKAFHRDRSATLGTWFWRYMYRSVYRKIFLRVMLEVPSVDHRSRSAPVDWPAIEAAAEQCDENGRRPTCNELALRYQVTTHAIYQHFRRRGLTFAPTYSDRYISREQRVEIENEREERIRTLASIWLAEGNINSFASMVRGLPGPEFDWISRRGHFERYRKVFRKASQR